MRTPSGPSKKAMRRPGRTSVMPETSGMPRPREVRHRRLDVLDPQADMLDAEVGRRRGRPGALRRLLDEHRHPAEIEDDPARALTALAPRLPRPQNLAVEPRRRRGVPAAQVEVVVPIAHAGSPFGTHPIAPRRHGPHGTARGGAAIGVRAGSTGHRPRLTHRAAPPYRRGTRTHARPRPEGWPSGLRQRS